MLKIRYIRDGQNRILGSVTEGFGGGTSVVRDRDGKLAGVSSRVFHTTRDPNGRIISIDTADPGLLLRRDR